MTTAHTANTAKKSAKTSKNKVSKYSKRKVDPAFYWMTVPAAILVHLPVLAVLAGRGILVH